MKAIIVVLIALAVCSAEYCGNCESNPCPENSNCVPHVYNGNTYQACQCIQGYFPMCKNTTDGGKALVCFATVSNSSTCGASECNDDQVCAVPDTQYAKCVCKDQLKHPDADGNCVCRDGLQWDDQQQSCVPAYPTSCDEVDCADGYKCIMVPVPAGLADKAVCVADRSNVTLVTCGVNFRCPDRYQCVQTERGPSCICADGWGGVNCEKLTCFTDGNETCPENSSCMMSADGQSTVCICDQGYYGPYCNQTGLSCANVNCSFANSECRDGMCRCTEGFVPDFQSKSCVPASNNNTNCVTGCNANSVCASVTSEVSRCVCMESFGGPDCSKPSCSANDDCGNNQVCVVNTRPNVPPFCACKFGYTGENCETQIHNCSCTANHTVCSNEGTCVCTPGWSGDNCSQQVSVNCSSFIITINGTNSTVDATDANEVKTVLLDILGIDNANLQVTDPVWRDREHRIIAWTVTICGDDTVDETATSDDLVNNYESALQMGMSVTSVQEGSTLQDVSGAVAFAPLFLLVAMFTLLL